MKWDMRGAYPLMKFKEELMMKTVMRFHYVNVDGMDTDVDIFVLIDESTNNLKHQIEDAISSYIDAVEDWQYEELVRDVLDSFGFDYEIVNPITFYI